MKKYFNASEIARIEGISRAVVSQHVKDGKFGKVNKVGDSWRIPADNYVKWKKERAGLNE